jgi:hypothetical protein
MYTGFVLLQMAVATDRRWLGLMFAIALVKVRKVLRRFHRRRLGAGRPADRVARP